MTPVPGSESSRRGETAPPITPSEKLQRSGYAMLAVSGVVVATAFGAVAELAGGGFTEAGATPPRVQGTAPSGGSQLIPGSGVPGTDTMTITGVAEAGALPSSSAPTTVVTIGPDGTPTTTILPPPPAPPGTPGQPDTSDRSDLPSDTTPGGPSDPDNPGEPEPEPEPTDPDPTEPDPTDPDPTEPDPTDPTGPGPTDPPSSEPNESTPPPPPAPSDSSTSGSTTSGSTTSS